MSVLNCRNSNACTANSTKPHPRGFTLIELMVVVAILAILATVAVPWFGKQVCNSRQSEAYTILKQIQGQYFVYANARGTYENATFPLLGVQFLPGRRFTYTIGGSGTGATQPPDATRGYNNDATLTAKLNTCNGIIAGAPAAAHTQFGFSALACGNIDGDAVIGGMYINDVLNVAAFPSSADDCSN